MKNKIKGFLYDFVGLVFFILFVFFCFYTWSDTFHGYVNGIISKSPTEIKTDSITTSHDTIKVVNREAKDSIPLTCIDNAYYINVIINNIPMRLILDTGCNKTSLTNIEELFLQHHSNLKIDTVNTVQIADGSNIEVNSGTLSSIKIGKSTFKNIECNFIQSQDAEPLLGQNVLSLLGTVAIDYKNNYLLVY